MSLFDGIFGRRKVKLSSPENWNLDWGSHAGKPVTQDSTLNLSTAWACVRIKSRVVGSLPLMMYERGPNDTRKSARDHWLYNLIHDSPNADQTAYDFWSGQVAAIDLWGNAFAEKIPGVGDRIAALEPLRPDITTVYRDPTTWRRKYRYSDPTHGVRVLDEDQVLHIKGFTVGGDVGLSAISYGRHTLGLALAADEVAGRTFAQGLQLAGFMELDAATKMNDQQREGMLKLFEKFLGSDKLGKVMPLEAGWKFVPIRMNPQDAQLLETRGFNVEEICRWFDVLPVLIGHAAQGQTMWGTGIEQIMLGWLTANLDPLLINIEQAIWKQVLPVSERPRFFAEFKREALLRADSEGRAALMSSLGQNGYLTRNEGRALDNRPPLPGGDVLTVQSNMIKLDDLGKQPPTATVEPPPAPRRGKP